MCVYIVSDKDFYICVCILHIALSYFVWGDGGYPVEWGVSRTMPSNTPEVMHCKDQTYNPVYAKHALLYSFLSPKNGD